MPTVLIAGGTGMIGTTLVKLLTKKGYSVIILTRSPKAGNGTVSNAAWDTEQQTIDVPAVQKADYIINLSGAGIADKRWTKKRKKVLVDSRVKSGELLVKALRENSNHVKAVINASATGWYGDDRDTGNNRPFIETDRPHDDFLGTTCVNWEESIEPVTKLGKRLVKFRMGVVLSTEGGALVEFKRPLRFGIAAILGSGNQKISWIHIEDVCRMYLYAIENETVQGVYNAVAPNPVSNKALTITLAKQLRGNFYLPMPVPSFVLKLVFGELSIEVLKSATISNKKISDTGFQFLYPSIEAALANLFHVP